jgi:hypothetical protein
MIFNSDELLNELKKHVQNHIDFSKSLLEISEKILQHKPITTSWSVLECLEHLNLYGNFYLPEIQQKINTSKHKHHQKFKSGFLGHKFATDMLPKANMKTMNTFKSKNPIHTSLEKEKVVLQFIHQQEKMLKLLETASTKNLTKIKTAITLPLLKFRLGDTFRFVIYHNERHIVQAQKVLKSLN